MKHILLIFTLAVLCGCDVVYKGCREACPVLNNKACIETCSNSVKPYWQKKMDRRFKSHKKNVGYRKEQP